MHMAKNQMDVHHDLRSRCPGYSDVAFGNLTARRKRGGPSVDWPSDSYLGRNTRSRFSP